MSVFQFAENVARKMVFDLGMAWYRLAGVGSRILVPIVSSAVPDEDASRGFDFPDEFSPLHAS